MSFLYYALAALVSYAGPGDLSTNEWIIGTVACLALAELAGIKEAVEKDRKK
jgi:hypothetical protein